MAGSSSATRTVVCSAPTSGNTITGAAAADIIACSVRQTLGSGRPRAYAAAMAGLWFDLRPTLASLDAIAADPWLLDDDVLPPLQYELHCAVEATAGLTPPEGAGAAHRDLARALAEARDATAEVVETYVSGGLDAVQRLVWEWRVVLFRVRYARLRLDPAPSAAAPAAGATAEPSRTPEMVTACVILAGCGLILAAALLGLWLIVALALAVTLAASFRLR